MSLSSISFDDNLITDLTPFVDNFSISDGDSLNIRGNPLNIYSCTDGITELESRGVTVYNNCKEIDPHVSSESGKYGETISQPGWGFTPFGTAQLLFRHESGYEEITVKDVDINGTFQHYYNIPDGKLTGTWYYSALDIVNQIWSDPVSYKISSNVTISPYVTVNPTIGSKSTGTYIDESGFGFTPNSPVTLYFLDPNGLSYSIQIEKTDNNGNYVHSYTCYAGTVEGVWEYYAFDEVAKVATEKKYITIVP
jgi:hypothetical protein